MWLEATSLFLSCMLPVEYIYGDWYWWLSTNEAKRNAKSYMLSLGDNCILSGSRIEGFCIPQLYLSQREGELATANLLAAMKWEPDLDGMRARKHCSETEDGGNFHPIFVAEHLSEDPRYVKLRLTDAFKGEFTRYADSEFLNHAYLFPEGRHPFLTNMKGWSYESHGPVRKLESTGITAYEEDLAYVFTYPEAWPEPAMEWLTRDKEERPHGWPSPDIVQDVFEGGCHIAPVGRGKRSREPLALLEYARSPSTQAPVPGDRNGMDENEWRVSFSVAENKLAATLPPVQRHVMVLLKMLKKLYFQDLISTYHLKQLLFWECERNPSSFWKEDNLSYCLLYMLDVLVERLKEGHLPHYIIRSSNLLQDVDADLLNRASEAVIEVRRNLLGRSVSMFRRLQSLTYLTNIYLQGLSYDDIVSRLQNRHLDEAGRRSLKLDICTIFAQKCSDAISSANRSMVSEPECTQLLLVPVKSYQSILARILCRKYALTCEGLSIEKYLAEETGCLPHGDQIAALSLAYYEQIAKGVDPASFVSESRAMIEVRELRRKEASRLFEEIDSSHLISDAFALLQRSDLQAIEKKLTKGLKGQLDTISYECLEQKVMEELDAIFNKRQSESSGKNEA